MPFSPDVQALSDEARAGPSDYDLEARLLENTPVAGPLDYAPSAEPQPLPHTRAGPLTHSPIGYSYATPSVH